MAVYLCWIFRVELEHSTCASGLWRTRGHALGESAVYVGYQLTDHTCIEGGEESVESLGRVVGLSVCIAEPLEG